MITAITVALTMAVAVIATATAVTGIAAVVGLQFGSNGNAKHNHSSNNAITNSIVSTGNENHNNCNG